MADQTCPGGVGELTHAQDCSLTVILDVFLGLHEHLHVPRAERSATVSYICTMDLSWGY